MIGKIGDTDVAMYPMLKVADCAKDPTEIDTDSAWFLQETHESEEDYSIGEVGQKRKNNLELSPGRHHEEEKSLGVLAGARRRADE